MDDVNLVLRRITSASPTRLLERVVEGEAVHAFRSWSDLENRLASDRRCYALVHPDLPLEPLLFTEVALAAHVPGEIHTILDEEAPTLDEADARVAVFYSISNMQPELRGRSLGFSLLQRAMAELRQDLPQLCTFTTLSPIPAFTTWLRTWLDADGVAPLSASTLAAVSAHRRLSSKDALRDVLTGMDWTTDVALASQLLTPMTRLAEHFLLEVKRDGRPADPVARFHLGNGARVARVNWMADTSPKGLSQSCSLMVNYQYTPVPLEHADVLALSA